MVFYVPFMVMDYTITHKYLKKNSFELDLIGRGRTESILATNRYSLRVSQRNFKNEVGNNSAINSNKPLFLVSQPHTYSASANVQLNV